MPRLGLGMPLTAGLSQEAVTIIDDFFFESDTSGEVTPIYTASRKQFARNNNDVVLTSAVTKDTSITVPPGQTGTAIRVIETTANSQHYATTVIDEVTAGDTYTMSLYVKSTYSQIIIYTNTTQISSNVTVNFTNKTIATSALRAGIEDAGGGWYRVNWTQVAQASGSSKIYLVVKDLSSYTGSTSNFTDYFGMQVEQDSRASSFMLNTTNDVLTVSTTLNDTSEVWDFDSTDIMLEADPEDEGFWEEGSNIVLNGDYEELSSELVTNGAFDTGSDWTFESSWGVSGGKANYDAVVNQHYLKQTLSSISAGETVKIQFDISDVAAGKTAFLKLEVSGTPETVFTYTHFSAGTYTFYHKLTSGLDRLNFVPATSSTGGAFSIDNVSVKQVDPNDRWTLGTGWSIEDGKAVAVATDTSGFSITQNNVLTAGVPHEITFTVSERTAGSVRFRADSVSGTTRSADGTYTEIITPAGHQFAIQGLNSFVGKIDNVTVKEYAIQPQDV